MKSLIVNPLTTPILDQTSVFKTNGLSGSSSSLWLSTLKHTLLVITPDIRQANQIKDEIQFFSPEKKSIIFPDWETLPYDTFSPLPEIISERLRILNQLIHGQQPNIIIAKASTLMMPLPPPDFIIQHCLELSINQELDLDLFTSKLSYYGYEKVHHVHESCQYAVRGCLLDIYPSGSTLAYRIEFFDNQIETIRSIDIESQHSDKPSSLIKILPAHEFIFPSIKDLRLRSQQLSFEPSSTLVTKLTKQKLFGGIEYYLPLFHSETSTLFDYIHDNCIKIWLPNSLESTTSFYNLALKQFNEKANQLSPKQLFKSPDDILTLSESKNSYHITEQNKGTTTQTIPEKTRVNEGLDIKLLNKLIQDNHTVIIIFQNQTRKSYLDSILKHHSIHPHSLNHFHIPKQTQYPVNLVVGYLHEGFLLVKEKIWIIRDDDIISSGVKTKTTSHQQISPPKIEFNELSIGDPIVHLDFGVGLYQGLKSIAIKNRNDEFIIIEYNNGQQIYLPLHRIDLISRYRGQTENLSLDKLGKNSWSHKKKIAEESIHILAKELMQHYAELKKLTGIPLPTPQEMTAFAQEFIYEETSDQSSAIQTILQKLNQPVPMDHLVCGDVGFGKTEVAMRAMFVAALNQFQCVLLAPTTVLCEQHYESLCNRFHHWPIKVGILNRFNSSNQTIENFNQSKIDILVCTHKILHQSLTSNNIALIVIDEEHKFGVKQKEKLNHLFMHAHKLALSATPIPRTLNMALSKFKSMSIIASPPPKRVPVKTFIMEQDNDTLIQAIQREIFRGGQVYYLINAIHKLSSKKEVLSRCLPGISIETLHAKLNKPQLQSIMRGFTQQEIQILLCTTIIEAGIDIPNANTLIIENADHFGLAQLHQIRGRIGRSHHQAYAYFFVNDLSNLAGESKQRLMALSHNQSLGCGMNIALQDLEIRGAGTFLGKEQSGHIHKLGYNLYMTLLEKALNQTDGLSDDKVSIDHNIHHSIPEEYISQSHQRIAYHHKIATTVSTQDLDKIIDELEDQFGVLPLPTLILINLAKLRIHLQSLYAKHATILSETTEIEFTDKTQLNTKSLMELIEKGIVAIQGPLNISIHLDQESDPNQNIIMLINILNKISDNE
ncbi:MAG TPA: transcription-repair coupling factor [Gammaproteobacteria bacterium]|nr:transcription-repair coupling factor [Gammaproteobacteria bacterium]